MLGTGVSHSVRELLETACSFVDLNPQDIVEVRENHTRPEDIDELRADPRKAKRLLGWTTEMDFGTLINMMVQYDIQEIAGKLNGKMFVEVGGVSVAY